APPPARGCAGGETDPGRTKVAVLGHRLWTRRFGGDPNLVGRTIQLNREPYEVVGIAPPDFSFPEGVEVWTPLEHDEVFRTKSRGAWYLTVIGRLRPEASIESARDEVATIAARLARPDPHRDRERARRGGPHRGPAGPHVTRRGRRRRRHGGFAAGVARGQRPPRAPRPAGRGRAPPPYRWAG